MWEGECIHLQVRWCVWNFSLRGSECICFSKCQARVQNGNTEVRGDSWRLWGKAIVFPFLATGISMAWSPFLHTRLPVYVLSVCERCSLQPGVLLGGGRTCKGLSLVWNYVVVWTGTSPWSESGIPLCWSLPFYFLFFCFSSSSFLFVLTSSFLSASFLPYSLHCLTS